MATSKTYSISALAQEFQVTTRTIRFYEEKGLLSPDRFGTARNYSAADRTCLKLILRGKRLGFTLEESRDIISLYNPAAGNLEQLQRLMDKIRTRQQLLERQLCDITAMQRELRDAEENCQAAIAAADPTGTYAGNH
ncbi:MAG: MerR family DNA-binding transcriptional regulator [Porticoccaceae bacterium]|nr:MerR family DNA-binding transcriptional regulator [Porticoccaceae bacterium]